MSLKIGIFSSQEFFTKTLIEVINKKGKDKNITCEFVKLFPPTIEKQCPYKVLIDRISHVVPFIRSYLKQATLTGTYVINNPFLFSYDDKYYNGTLAKQIGIAVPKTILLPSKSHSYDFKEGDLHNLGFPIDWQSICDYTGFPAILKPVDGYGWQHVYKINNMDELFRYYDKTGEKLMILQEFIEFTHYVRCFVYGKKHVLPAKYDPHTRQYIVEHNHLSPEMGERIVNDCIKINEALGYDMNTVEFAIKDDIPYALDYMNPVPDSKPESITKIYFEWVLDKLSDVAIEYALRKE